MKFITIFYILTALPALAWAAETYQAKVVGITDGDTIKVLRTGNEQVKIRLAGIRKQPWGNRAKQAASDLVAGQIVTIDVMDIDRYRRTVGRVFVDGVNINRAMVEGRHCWTYVKYAKDKQLPVLQDQAMAENRGLWLLPESERVPP
jgi:endonuclease YncB( thermonuclease family)